MGQPVVQFKIGCRDSQKTQGFYSSLFGCKIAQEGPAAMIETGKGNIGHITALGHEPFTTQFFTWKWMTCRLISTKQLHFAEKLSSQRCQFLPALSPGCRVPKETRSAPSNPLQAEYNENRNLEERSLPSALKEVWPRRQYPYSSRKPILNPPSRGLRGAFENARRAHSPADAHGDQTIAPVAPFQFAQNRRRKFRTRATQRMA